MSLGRVAIAIALSADERLELERMVWGHKTWADLARRARIVLLSAVGLQNKAIAQRLGCAELTVSTWRKRFSVMRLDGLQDAARSGALRRIGDAAIAETVRLTLESLPAGSTHWSLRGMADKVGYAPSTIHRIWRAFGLQPHGAGTLKLSTDRLFVEKVRDIVGLYMSPPECAPVLMKSRRYKRLTGPSRSCRCRPGRSRGAATTTPVMARHRCPPPRTWRQARASASAIPVTGLRSSAISATRLKRMCLPTSISTSRWQVHFTPTSASWINQIERFVALLTQNQLRRSVHRSTGELEKAIHAYVGRANQTPKPFRWTKSADDILASIKRFCIATMTMAKTSESGH